MSGRIKADIVMEAEQDKKFFEAAGFEVLCPVTEEGVKKSNQVLLASRKEMEGFWKRDKEMIRNAHVVLNMTPHMRSVGVSHEYGYARYLLWKKVIHIYPEGLLPTNSSIDVLEDDYVTDDIYDAIGEILKTHGTLFKRVIWRLKLLNRCMLKFIVCQIGEWK